MAVRDWLTRKASKTIEAAVEPTKKAIQQTIAQKSDWGSKLMKFGFLAFLTMLAFRDSGSAGGERKAADTIPHITINNYIGDERSKKE